jgi:type III secretion protein R
MTYLKGFVRPKIALYLLVLFSAFFFIPSSLFSQTTPPAQQNSSTPPTPQTPSTVKDPARSPSQRNVESPKTPAQKVMETPFDTFQRPTIITQAAALSLMALLPFIVMILTSFLKIVIVLSLLRSALGVQQAPPNQIINGVAFMLSLFIMYPTVLKMYDASEKVINNVRTPSSLLSPESAQYLVEISTAAREPLREFLKKNSSVKHQALFYRIAYRILPESYRPALKPDDFMILVPSFITSQLKEAFEIGVLIYIPFFVIDLVTSNILLAMGMMMLSPVTISMPLKLFLLVMLDGWTLLIDGLVNTFR